MSQTSITDRHRQIRLNTVLGPDKLLPYRVVMTESLSNPFNMELECFSEDPNINLSDVLGHNLTVALDRPRGGTRYFNGFVTSFSFAGIKDRHFLYTATAAPALWFLTQSQNSRVFHEMSVMDIVDEVLSAYGISDQEWQVQGSYAPYDYCVQYGESDFNFVSRMLEREGIYYFFEHENGRHKIIFVDDKSAHQPHPEYDSIEFMERDEHSVRSRECIFSIYPRQTVRPTNFVTRDYNYMTPRADLTRDSSVARSHAFSGLEVYEYPGQYGAADTGANYAGARASAMQSDHALGFGEATARGLISGATFDLTNHPVDNLNAKYLVTSVEHTLTSDDYNTGGDSDVEIYSCRFTAMDANEQFRPARRARQPQIVGPQTAFVVGEGEIDADEHGRVLVSFHWEREGQASCRARVSQAWAGTEWGSYSIPRIGQEVIVEFENGDPDRPIITGRVYNAASLPGYDASQYGMYTSFKSNTVGGGGFNELRFDDTAGEENVFLHGQYNLDIRIQNDAVELFGNELHTTVGASEYRTIGDNFHETVGAEYRVTSGQDYHRKAGGGICDEASSNIDITAGGSAKTKAGSDIYLDAGTSITLKAGGNFIKIDPSGVTIVGTMVKINSGGMAGPSNVSGAANAEAPREPLEGQAGSVDSGQSRSLSVSPQQLDSHPVSAVLLASAQGGQPFCAICEAMRGGGGN